MAFVNRFGIVALGAVVVACAPPQPPPGAAAAEIETAPPFQPVASTLELMEGVMAHAAEVYWEAVSIVVDENGITEHAPQTDEEWEAVWAAAMSLAESGNLLMMAPRAIDQGEWIQWSTAMAERGREAIAAAAAKDSERVLAAGEQVYYVCVGCHQRYVAQDNVRFQ